MAVHGAMVLTRQPLPYAVVACAQLGVPIAAATIGTTSGLLPPHESAALLLGALVTIVAVTLVSGPLIRQAAPPAEAATE